MKTEFKTLTEAVLSIYRKYLTNNAIEYVTVGSTIILKLDENRCIEVRLIDRHTVDHFDAVRFDLKNKITGDIDQNIVWFKQVFDSPVDLTHPNKIQKHIWKDSSREYSWYGKPTTSDLKRLVRELDKYINIWK